MVRVWFCAWDGTCMSMCVCVSVRVCRYFFLFYLKSFLYFWFPSRALVVLHTNTHTIHSVYLFCPRHFFLRILTMDATVHIYTPLSIYILRSLSCACMCVLFTLIEMERYQFDPSFSQPHTHIHFSYGISAQQRNKTIFVSAVCQTYWLLWHLSTKAQFRDIRAIYAPKLMLILFYSTNTLHPSISCVCVCARTISTEAQLTSM